MRLTAVLLCLLVTGCATTERVPDVARSGSATTTIAPAPTLSPTTAPPAPPPRTSATSRPPRPDGTVVIAGDSEYGPMLYAEDGQPIYVFTAEIDDRPVCVDACAEAWPPVLTAGRPRARAGVLNGLLGVTRREDGSRQVTYAGHPLYFYAHEGPYQVLCHDVDEFGGTWLVLRPDGSVAA